MIIAPKNPIIEIIICVNFDSFCTINAPAPKFSA